MITTRVQVSSPNEWHIEQAQVREPGPGEVLLELDSAGICGGDLSLLHGKNSVASYPTILGHECVATVAGTGPQTSLTVGTPVVIYPTISCRRCAACLDGRTNNCSHMTVLGLTDFRGCFSSIFVLDESQCIPIPPIVFDQYSALIEPMAVAQHVLGRAGSVEGKRILVIGSGSIGLAIILTARAMGATCITAIDVEPKRAEVAVAAGADTFLISSDGRLLETTGGTASVPDVDAAFDVVALATTFALCQDAVVPGGDIVLVAAAKPQHILTIDYERMYGAEQSMAASRNYTRADFTAAVELIATGKIDVSLLRTKVVSIGDFQSALDALQGDTQPHLKVLVTTERLLGSRPILTDPS